MVPLLLHIFHEDTNIISKTISWFKKGLMRAYMRVH